MTLELKIHGILKKMKGPGSRAINKMLEEKVVPIIHNIITLDVHAKAVEFASGIGTPDQRVPQQATHAIGQSDSWYQSTGKLAESIKISYGEKHESTISTDLEYAPWLEWGTGKFGPLGRLIFPKKEGGLLIFPFQGKTIAAAHTQGQRPNPFFRGSIWFLIDNFSPTKDKIEKELRGI